MEPTITIRPIDSISEMKALETLQKRVWGWDEIDVMPLMNFIAATEVGGILIGAFHEGIPVGFVFGFVGYDDGLSVVHSHLLAVLPEYREHGVGLKLKLAQREQALERGYECITWTFDPLQSTNAHLNFAKLGVVARKYKINFYGEESSSQLHRHIGTDRLWVSWFLKSERVEQRLAMKTRKQPSFSDVRGLERMIQIGALGLPVSRPATQLTSSPVLIEIPLQIGVLQNEDPAVAVAWRKATRSAFIDAFRDGYTVEDFFRLEKDDQSIGCYLLTAEDPQ